jgi:hypothetical protein
MRRLILLGVLAALAGCGSEAPTASGPATNLLVTVDADGTGPEAPKQLRVRCDAERTDDACEDIANMPPGTWEPVKPRRVCTDIFGGPEVARVSGTLAGAPLSAKFSRQNGCEVTRWTLAAPLLDRVP